MKFTDPIWNLIALMAFIIVARTTYNVLIWAKAQLSWFDRMNRLRYTKGFVEGYTTDVNTPSDENCYTYAGFCDGRVARLTKQ